MILRRNWPAIPEDVKRTVRWNEWVFAGGRIDLSQYEGPFNPETLQWNDVINMMVQPRVRTNALNEAELKAELFGLGIEDQFSEPEIGGPADDPKQTGLLAPFNADDLIPDLTPSDLDSYRRTKAQRNISQDITRAERRRQLTQEQWTKEREAFFAEKARENGVTVDVVKEQWDKQLKKTGTYWADFFAIKVPKEGEKWVEGRYMEDKNREVYDKQHAAQIAAEQELDKTYSVAPTEIVVEDDPPLKPYKPDPPEVVQKLIDEIRAEAANRDREIPDPYVTQDWPSMVMDRIKTLKALNVEREEIKQQILDSGDVDGYLKVKLQDSFFGGTEEMVASSFEMRRIQKEKGHPGIFGRAVSWLLNSPYRLPTASFPTETWIPPFEQDPERYTLRAYPDPFEIATFRFRRTDTGFLGRIADWFSMRNNKKQWWWMPGDQLGITRFELWWQDYKEGDEFWTRVAPHVLRTSWFRRYATEYFTGAEWRTLKDMRNLEDFALSQQEYGFKALQHLYPRDKLDFEMYRDAIKGTYRIETEQPKADDLGSGPELRWGPNGEFKEAQVDTAGTITSTGWLLATSGTRKMSLKEAMEVLGYSAQLKAGLLPPLDEAKDRADKLDAANQSDRSRLATGWRRVVRELLKDPLLEPKIIEMSEITKSKEAAHSGKSPYLGGKAHSAFLAIERAHNGEILYDEDQLFMNMVKENLLAEAKASEEAAGKPAADAAAADAAKPAPAAGEQTPPPPPGGDAKKEGTEEKK